eukprot:scaffold287_cov337-Pavlova_lutheri.AAC.107
MWARRQPVVVSSPSIPLASMGSNPFALRRWAGPNTRPWTPSTPVNLCTILFSPSTCNNQLRKGMQLPHHRPSGWREARGLEDLPTFQARRNSPNGRGCTPRSSLLPPQAL